jgi:hypothetical protein
MPKIDKRGKWRWSRGVTRNATNHYRNKSSIGPLMPQDLGTGAQKDRKEVNHAISVIYF